MDKNNILTPHSRDNYRPIRQDKGQLVQTMRQHPVQKTQGRRGHEFIEKERESEGIDTINNKQSIPVESKQKADERQRVIMKNRN